MESHQRSKSDGHAQPPKAGSSSKSAKKEGRSSSTSELTRKLDELARDSDEEDLEENDLDKRELRRKRRMKVRARMEETRGAWHTERDKLTRYAAEQKYAEAARVWNQERKKEELRIEMEECRSLDEATAASMKRKREDLADLRNTLVKKITKRQRRKSIKKTLHEELKAYNMVKAESRKRVTEAQVEVDKNKLKETTIKHDMMLLWQNEAERWAEELEIPILELKSRHSPIEFSADDAEHLRNSLEKFRAHRGWCMNGPRAGKQWLYSNDDRQYECADCKDDIAYGKSL